MEYTWRIEDEKCNIIRGRTRDPVATDSHLAEIDFEDFNNQDLVYAFCNEEEESGSSISVTEMSICRSEPLFSSMINSTELASTNNLRQTSCRNSSSLTTPTSSSSPAMTANVSLMQDSLLAPDESFTTGFIDRIKSNKNNYTIAFSSDVQHRANAYSIDDTSSSDPLESAVADMSLSNPVKSDSPSAITTQYFKKLNDDCITMMKPPADFCTSPYGKTAQPENDKVNNNNKFLYCTKSQSLPNMAHKSMKVDMSLEQQKCDKKISLLPKTPGDIFMTAGKKGAHKPMVNRRLESIEEHFVDTSESSSTTSRDESPLNLRRYPQLDFFADNTEHWNSFLQLHKKSSKYKSVLKSPSSYYTSFSKAPDPESKVNRTIQDIESLRILLPESQKVLLSTPSKTMTADLRLRKWSASKESTPKRRSYHPQDYLNQVLGGSCNTKKQPTCIPKSASNEQISSTRFTSRERKFMPSAEYPSFQSPLNLNTPTNAPSSNLHMKRELFLSLYSVVERMQNTTDSEHTLLRCIYIHEFCPALQAILENGLKRDVITSFGSIKPDIWNVIEALTRSGVTSDANICDLVMLLNAKLTQENVNKKFAGFISGLQRMNVLHTWFSSLKWNAAVLLRFYERDSFVYPMHKETKLLFDELLFCIQRCYSFPAFAIDYNYSSSNDQGLDEYCTENCDNGEKPYVFPYPGGQCKSKYSTFTGQKRSRIPRPISLPKRIVDKLKLLGNDSNEHITTTTTLKSTIQTNTEATLEGIGAHTVDTEHVSSVKKTVELFNAKSNVVAKKPSEPHKAMNINTYRQRSKPPRVAPRPRSCNRGPSLGPSESEAQRL